jgi:hypothetical protein
VPKDCTSEVCTSNLCQAPACTDGVQNGTETDVDCGGGSCPGCATGKACLMDTDCASAGICDTKACRVAVSCAEILNHLPNSASGPYTIAPTGVATPFSAVCDMTRDGGGWTLILKATGSATLGYTVSAWTDTSTFNTTDMTTNSSDTKYQGFLSLPVTTLRGELDSFRFTQAITPAMTAQQIFAGPALTVASFPTIGTGANWSYQPNCQTYGVNTPYQYARARFGWTANQEANCLSNDTAIGLGLDDQGTDYGAGYECLSTQCSNGQVNTGGAGLLWAK